MEFDVSNKLYRKKWSSFLSVIDSDHLSLQLSATSRDSFSLQLVDEHGFIHELEQKLFNQTNRIRNYGISTNWGRASQNFQEGVKFPFPSEVSLPWRMCTLTWHFFEADLRTLAARSKVVLRRLVRLTESRTSPFCWKNPFYLWSWNLPRC